MPFLSVEAHPRSRAVRSASGKMLIVEKQYSCSSQCVFVFSFFSRLIFLSSLGMNKDGMNKDGMNKEGNS